MAIFLTQGSLEQGCLELVSGTLIAPEVAQTHLRA